MSNIKNKSNQENEFEYKNGILDEYEDPLIPKDVVLPGDIVLRDQAIERYYKN